MECGAQGEIARKKTSKYLYEISVHTSHGNEFFDPNLLSGTRYSGNDEGSQ